VVSALGIGLVAMGLGSAELILRRVYDCLKPSLERQLGELLGHPLQLGEMRGIGWLGVELGPARLLPVAADRSTVMAQGLSVSLDPWASLRQREAVLQLDLSGVEANLQRNRNGQYWVLGPFKPAAKQPRLALRLRLLQPARLRLEPAGLRARVSAELALQPRRHSLQLQGRLQPSQGGSVWLQLAGKWNKQRWTAKLRGERLPLAPLQPALKLPGRLGGQAQGELELSLAKNRIGCQGGLRLSDLQWQQGSSTPLRASAINLGCRGQQLQLQAPSWQYGNWRGNLALTAHPQPAAAGLLARADGLQGLAMRWTGRLEARQATDRSQPLRLNASGLWSGRELRGIQLQARKPGLRLEASGSLGDRLDLSSRFQIQPAALGLKPAPPDWLLRPALSGRLRATGALRAPSLQAELEQQANPLLGPWQASLLWNGQQLLLRQFRSDQLLASGSLPLEIRANRGLSSGDLALKLQLRRYPLARLQPVIGSRLEGVLDVKGEVRGPLRALVPNLELALERPGAGPLALPESWQGQWRGQGAGGGNLRMVSLAPAPVGQLSVRLDRRWLPVAVQLQRGGGSLELAGEPKAYQWQAQRLSLDGLQLQVGPKGRFQPLQGRLSGKGLLNLQPLAFAGQVGLDQPAFLGVRAQQLQLQGRYGDRNYSAKGSANLAGGGHLDLDWSGRWHGAFRSRIAGRGLGANLFRELAAAWPHWRGEPGGDAGRAADLGNLVFDSLGASVEDQLAALDQAHARLLARQTSGSKATAAQRLEHLQARVDLDLALEGPSLAAARADLALRGHLWLDGADQDLALTGAPLVARMQGPLGSGDGSFSLEQLPLSLVALLTQLPPELRGSFTARGRYRLGGSSPALAMDLGLRDGRLRNTPLALEQGRVALDNGRLKLNLALRAAGASSSVDLSGLIPIDPTSPELQLRLASRGDGLRFLASFAEPNLVWQQGSADMQLLVRGSLQEPIVNGFLGVRQGQLRLFEQTLSNLQGTVLFDFEQLDIQQLSASVGAKGSIGAKGSLGLWRDLPQTAGQGLTVELKQVPFKLPQFAAQADGDLLVRGNLRQLVMGGDLRIARGNLNAQGGQLANAQGGQLASGGDAKGVSVPELVESGWDFRQPLLLLMGPQLNTDATAGLRSSLPEASPLAFDNLRLRFGPDLRVGVPNLANFSVGGQLRLSGRLDSSLRASGLVRLLKGRVNLFTTSFSLDPEVPNVAVFTPSLGLMPYVDIALRTRVSDSLASGGIGLGGLENSSGQSLNQFEGASSLNPLNLVRITVSASGPADRIAENLQLRSSPPMAKERLLALIGGNSLAGLSGGRAGAALATVVGQSLLSPVLGGLSEVFGERVSVALYPTYVSPELTDGKSLRSQQVPPQLVLGTEIGLDVSDRFNASVLTAPNRSDIPNQLTLTYKASEILNLQGSFNTQGAWQGQLQLFFRF
jgi:translocation and assembly module TamB